MKKNKYTYLKVIQQYFTGAYGWEDVSKYETDSTGYLVEEERHSGKFVTNPKNGRTRELDCLTHDLREYNTMGYPTRVIFRKELNTELV